MPAGLTLAVVAGFALRARCFHPYADGWDPCEFVWAIEGGFLPHSPYILYLWVGRLLSLAMPAEIALSAVSLVSGMAVLVLPALLARRQSGSGMAAGVAAGAGAVFPCAVWFSGIQEVYAMAGALGLASLLAAWADGWRRALLSGVLFGCALATHSGMIFIAPALALALLWGPAAGPAGGRKSARLLIAAGGGLIVPAAAVAWVATELTRPAGAGQSLPVYLAGIAPMSAGVPSGGWLGSMTRALQGALEQTSGTGPSAAVLAACLVLAATRFARPAIFWIVYAAPYLLYETAIGWNVDPGVHMVFAGPAVAAILGCGAAAAVSWVTAGRAKRGASAAAAACVAAVGLALLPAAARSYGLAEPLVSRGEFLSAEPVATLIAARADTPPHAVIVQPPAIDNVNLVPAYAGRRPIIHQEGRYLLFEGVRGSPLNLSSFTPLTRQILDRLLQEGAPVISLVPDPFPVAQAGFWWRPDGRHFVLERGLPAPESR